MHFSSTYKQLLSNLGLLDQVVAVMCPTTTIKFIVNVPSNPSPSLVQDLYQATATLTATNNL